MLRSQIDKAGTPGQVHFTIRLEGPEGKTINLLMVKYKLCVWWSLIIVVPSFILSKLFNCI